MRGKKARNLFAFLVLYSHLSHRRESLADLLWPDAPPERVRRNLSDTLYRLRRALGPGWISVDGEYVTLKAEDLWVDVWAFKRWAQVDDAAVLAEAVALYQGDLLSEIYDDWILEQRLALREAYLACLLRLGQLAEQHNQQEDAFKYYQRLTHADPLREEGHRGLMRSLASMGRLAEALIVYDQLERLLANELDIPPSEPTQTLAARLRGELELQTATQGRSHISQPFFVGRATERSHLLARLDQAMEGNGGIVTVLGEAGIGKTRLLQELAQAASWRGWQVAWGRGQEFSLLPTYTPLRQALAAALPKPRLQQLAQLVQPFWLSVLAGLVPEVNETFRDSLPPVSAERQLLPVAIGHLWHGLEQISPHLFILDDIQWADPGVWTLLDELRPALAERAVLIVVSGRTNELKDSKMVWPQLLAWDRAGHATIQLSGLNLNELQALARTSGHSASRQQLERLSHTSGGNPLLALTLLEAGNVDHLPGNATLMSQLLQRLATLSDAANSALQAAAVIGYQFDYSTWEAVTRDIPAASLPALAGELERAGLVYLEAEGYRFAHDSLRACVYTHISGERRSWLHQNALTVLAKSQPAQVVSLLFHAKEAGERQTSAGYALQAGQQALSSFTYQAAVDYFTQALTQLQPDDWHNRYVATLGRLDALDILADREAQRADLDYLQELAGHLNLTASQIEVARRWASFHQITGDLAKAEYWARQGLVLAQETGDLENEAALWHMLGQNARNQGDYQQAQVLVLRAHDLYCQAGSRLGEALATDMLGGLAWNQGDFQTAATLHQQAADMFREQGDLVHESLSLNNLGSALWGLGDYVRARITHERALAVCRETGYRRSEADNLDNLGGIAWVLGDYATAIDYYSESLAIRRQMKDTWGISISLGNLGSAHRLLSQYKQALDYYDEALVVNRSMGRRRGEGYVEHGRGLVYLEMGHYEKAREALTAAEAIRTELGEQDNLIETNAALALLWLTTNHMVQAKSCLQAALESLTTQPVRPSLRQWVHYVAHRVYQAQEKAAASAYHLYQAEASMHETARGLPESERTQFLRQVPLNRQTQAAIDEARQRVQVCLVRANVPLGRKLTDADYIVVTWTVYAPDDEQFAKPGQRRQHVLKRLLAEAGQQGATPTDDDLAKALGVSRRTILRDMQDLAGSGLVPPTRKRI